MKKKILILSSLVMLFVGVFSINSFASSFNPDDTLEEVNPNETMSLIYEPDLYYLPLENVGTYVVNKFATYSKSVYDTIIGLDYNDYYATKEQIASGLTQSSPSNPINHYFRTRVKGIHNGITYYYPVLQLPTRSTTTTLPSNIVFYWENVVISGRDINSKSTISFIGTYGSSTDFENDTLISGIFSGTVLVKGQQQIEFSSLPFSYEFAINPYNYRPDGVFTAFFEIDLFSYFFESFGLKDTDYLVLNNSSMSFNYTRPNGATANNTIGLWGRFDSPTNAPTLADVFNSYDFSDLQPTIDFEDISYVDWIVNSVKSFVDFEIFPNFSIGNILGILISMALAIWILKVFMGG